MKCFETQYTNEKLILTCEARQRIATDHVRAPSPMIGQYKLDLWVNSSRDSSTNSTSLGSIRHAVIVREDCSLTFPPLSMSKLSYIQLRELERRVENEHYQASKW